MRRLSPEEAALWRKVVESVTPLHTTSPKPEVAPVTPTEQIAAPVAPSKKLKGRVPPPRPAPAPALVRSAVPGTTLDGIWDRRLSRGLVQPDMTVDLHGHNLATAYDMLDMKLEQGLGMGVRVILLITGKPPRDDRRPVARGAIRAAVGDWLGASRHATEIAAVRNAHPRHGGSGALYIVLRRRR